MQLNRRGQNAVQFMVITAVILTVVGVVAISAASDFEKTLSLASVRNTASSFAGDHGYLLERIETSAGGGYYNFSLILRRERVDASSEGLVTGVLNKIAVVLNQPAPQVNADGCSLIAHYTYCVKVNEN